jgi:hypothetical protein
MTAGTGIAHAEYSDQQKDTQIFQIWITPRARGLAPSWDQAELPKEPANESLHLLVSGRNEDLGPVGDGRALYINQDASIWGRVVEAGTVLNQKLRGPSYVVVSSGTVEIDGEILTEGDGAEITDLKTLPIKARSAAELLVIEV